MTSGKTMILEARSLHPGNFWSLEGHVLASGQIWGFRRPHAPSGNAGEAGRPKRMPIRANFRKFCKIGQNYMGIFGLLGKFGIRPPGQLPGVLPWMGQ